MSGLAIYVAGKFEEAPRVQKVMDRLIDAGHWVTYDWTEQEQASPRQAILDLSGVAGADVVVFVFEKDLPYRGTYAELGAALALGKPVYILGHAGDACIFTKHPNVKYGIEDLL